LLNHDFAAVEQCNSHNITLNFEAGEINKLDESSQLNLLNNEGSISVKPQSTVKKSV